MASEMWRSSFRLQSHPPPKTSILEVTSCSKIAAGVPVIMSVFQAEVKEKVACQLSKSSLNKNLFYKP